jgi:2-phosphosulfolactate phosphatase
VVSGKLLVMTTTNGTSALLATQGAAAVYAAAAANLDAAGARARRALEENGDLLVLCAGREQGFALDDAYAAGRLAMAAMGGRRRKGLNDAALASVDLVRHYGLRWDRPLALSRAGRELMQAGFAPDIADASRENAYPVLAQFHERRVTVAAP